MTTRITALAVCAAVLSWAAAPQDFDRVARLAAEARQAGQVSQAVDLYRQAVALRPEWAEGWWYLGTLYYSTGRQQPALDSFRRITSRNPHAGPAFALAGLCEFELREYAEAFQDLQKARAYGAGDDPKMLSAAQFELALLYNRYGSHDQAYRILQSVVRETGEQPALVEALGLSALHIPQLPSEIPDTKRALVSEAGRAAWLAAQHRDKEALPLFEQLAAHHPDTPGVHYALGAFLLDSDPQRALREFRRELEIEPENGYARLQIALELIRENDFQGAAGYAAEAARAEPRWYMTRLAYGQALLELGRTADAIPELEAGAKLAPAVAQAHFQLARAYRQAGRAADAAREQSEFKRLESAAESAHAN